MESSSINDYLFEDPLEETLNDARRRCSGGRHVDGGDGVCIECLEEIFH